jgi:hypothetical protein
MLLWFVATSVLTIHVVFGDPRFDYRWLIVGSVVPVVADMIGGWTSMVSAVSAGVVVLAAVMLATIGRREVRRRMLGFPIGMLLHMVFGGSWNTTEVFWWPFAGVDLSDAPALAGQRWPVGMFLEVLGLLGCVWIIRRNSLADATRRRDFLSDGRLEFR